MTGLGAGIVGTEAASVFAGADVRLVARADLPLQASLGEPIAAQLRGLHLMHTDFRPGRVVQAVKRSSRGVEVRLDDGTRVRASKTRASRLDR
ncbi:FAD-dependent oxidoreductase [Glaciibacter superstes]|uniref:FAD-dependent oxidoreductase n=1 Tax=Glaciibacter superstes TaxID=501023 RepID=UPI003CCC261F